MQTIFAIKAIDSYQWALIPVISINIFLMVKIEEGLFCLYFDDITHHRTYDDYKVM